MKERNRSILYEIFALVLLFLKLFIPEKNLKILSVYFHNPPPDLFEKVIVHLLSRKYRIVSPDELYEIICFGRITEKIAIITIDDGFRNNLKLLNIIRKYKVFTTIFVATSAIENGNFWFEYVPGEDYSAQTMEKIRLKKLNEVDFYKEINTLAKDHKLSRTALTISELKELSSEPYVIIGSHTDNHLCLPSCSLQTQKAEMVDSKKYLENWTGKTIDYFSFPMGDYNENLKQLAKQSGYRMSFSTETGDITLKDADLFAFPRRCVNDNAGYFEAISKVYGIWYRFRNS